ncbi:unnamed protein product [Tilletia controversa]|uniref:Uncharacterized protein n=4 Tax=Tilletia TaxID=13289 RepID=A0A8X7N0U5_9BASI|nr:hypothetical protein CF336_g220 [Tilletia laevis]KAE8205852.1 hypothetical protein CF328_g243 [Tilletia controversa]KAE8264153.1 hypothetical protein A4X03_0g1148 [Tilletia caries]KAE8255965.1 hypothetical protein A4X06_0g149 [Tilletia controversa]CAD6886883.1 unnamed protein product [Tilletia caries]
MTPREMRFNTSAPQITSLPPISICLDCQTAPLIITTLFQVQASIFLGSVITLLGAMAFAQFLFAHKKTLRSGIFWGSNLALFVTVLGLALTMTEIIPGAPQLKSKAYLNMTCARRFVTIATPYAWSVVLLGKLYAFYPPSVRERKHSILLGVLIVLKARLLVDITSVAVLCGGLNAGRLLTRASQKLYIANVWLDCVDDIIVTTVLLRKSYRFYNKARLRLSTNSRRIRFIFESIGMTFVGALPAQIIYAIGLTIAYSKPDTFSAVTQYWVALWMFSTVGIFGVLSTTWSSIGTGPMGVSQAERYGPPQQGQYQHHSPAIEPSARLPTMASSASRTGDIGQERLHPHAYEDLLDINNNNNNNNEPAAARSTALSVEPTETLLSIFLVGDSSSPPDRSPTLAGSSSSSERKGDTAEKRSPPLSEMTERRSRWLQLRRPPRADKPRWQHDDP